MLKQKKHEIWQVTTAYKHHGGIEFYMNRQQQKTRLGCWNLWQQRFMLWNGTVWDRTALNGNVRILRQFSRVCSLKHRYVIPIRSIVTHIHTHLNPSKEAHDTWRWSVTFCESASHCKNHCETGSNQPKHWPDYKALNQNRQKTVLKQLAPIFTQRHTHEHIQWATFISTLS